MENIVIYEKNKENCGKKWILYYEINHYDK